MFEVLYRLGLGSADGCVLGSSGSGQVRSSLLSSFCSSGGFRVWGRFKVLCFVVYFALLVRVLIVSVHG